MRTTLISFVLLGTLASVAARADEPPKLLLQDIQPKGIDPDVASSLTDLLELAIERGRLFTVVSQQDLRALLKIEEQRILLGLEEGQEERMAELARKVDAPYALATSVGKVGDSYVLSLRLLDVGRVSVIRRINQTLVGDETGLIGSIRTAALALTLEEKGIAPDLSAELIDDLTISEKPKAVFLSLSPYYEVPLGFQKSEDDIVIFRPEYMGFRLEAELPVWRWVRVFASIGVGFTINAEEHQATNDLTLIYEDGENPTGFQAQGTGFSVDFDSMRVPIHLGVKFAPETGRFLPYALLGIGVSYLSFDPGAGSLELWREAPETGCEDPYTPHQSGELDLCILRDARLEPEGTISEFGFEATAAAGVEFLLTHHLGLKAEVRYQFLHLFKSDADLRVRYAGEVDTDAGRDELFKLIGVRAMYHNLAFSAGLVAYW